MLFIVASAPSTAPPPPAAAVQTIAIIRIERPAIANSREWERANKSSRREIILRDRRGRPVLVRLIEYE